MKKIKTLFAKKTLKIIGIFFSVVILLFLVLKIVEVPEEEYSKTFQDTKTWDRYVVRGPWPPVYTGLDIFSYSGFNVYSANRLYCEGYDTPWKIENKTLFVKEFEDIKIYYMNKYFVFIKGWSYGFLLKDFSYKEPNPEDIIEIIPMTRIE